jgi:hypothetical protein
MSGKFEWKSDTYYGLEKVLSFPMNLIPFFREKKDVHNSESLFMHRISSAKQTLYDNKSCKAISVSMYQKFLWSFFDPEESDHTLKEISILNRWVSVGGKLRAKRRRLAHQLRNICCFFFPLSSQPACHQFTNLPRLLPPSLVQCVLNPDAVTWHGQKRDGDTWTNGKLPPSFCCRNHDASWTKKQEIAEERPIQQAIRFCAQNSRGAKLDTTLKNLPMLEYPQVNRYGAGLETQGQTMGSFHPFVSTFQN